MSTRNVITEGNSGIGNTPATRATPDRRIVARPEDARSHNRVHVLQVLYRSAGLSRADIARELGLTRVTVSEVVAALIAEGLVVELDPRADSRPGKPATPLDINRSGFHIIGVDFSSSHTFRGAITDLSGKVLEHHKVSVEGLVGDGAVAAAGDLIEVLMAKATKPVIGVGVGTPGLVNDHGEVLSAPGLGWHHVPLQALLTQRVGLPVLVANDANAAALAERTFGSGSDDLMVVRIGRGVGSGLVVGGHPLRGARWAAGEIGHVVVGTDQGPPCSCGKNGCLETWIAAPQIEARLTQASTDAQKREVIAQAGARLGEALAPVVGALNLEEIVVAGPAEVLSDVFVGALSTTLGEHTMDDLHGHLTVRATTLAPHTVILGAVVMVLSTQLGVS